MIYANMLNAWFRWRHGDPPEVAEGDASALVMVADGVGGFDLCVFGLRHVAVGSGDDGDDRRSPLVRAFSWGVGWGRWHADLCDVDNHRAKSGALADELMAWRSAHPGVPTFVVGKSGGTGIVARALELLPEGAVEAAVLLSPALSPGYDLTRALRAIRRELVVFWSPLDVFVLGAGTFVFGTVDRVHSVSAGLVGFHEPAGLDDESRAQYGKLHQVRWTLDMARSWYFGGHVGTDHPAFLRKYVVPLLREAEAVPEAVGPAGVKPPSGLADNHGTGGMTRV